MMFRRDDGPNPLPVIDQPENPADLAAWAAYQATCKLAYRELDERKRATRKANLPLSEAVELREHFPRLMKDTGPLARWFGVPRR